ncbi:unnamed protein product [Urochloa humidicola]
MAATMGSPNLRIPAFDGNTNPLPWLHRCNQCFEAWETEEEEKIWIATFKLKGAAYEWYCQIERNVGVPTWPRFVAAVSHRFAPASPTSPAAAIAAPPPAKDQAAPPTATPEVALAPATTPLPTSSSSSPPTTTSADPPTSPAPKSVMSSSTPASAAEEDERVTPALPRSSLPPYQVVAPRAHTLAPPPSPAVSTPPPLGVLPLTASSPQQSPRSEVAVSYVLGVKRGVLRAAAARSGTMSPPPRHLLQPPHPRRSLQWPWQANQRRPYLLRRHPALRPGRRCPGYAQWRRHEDACPRRRQHRRQLRTLHHQGPSPCGSKKVLRRRRLHAPGNHRPRGVDHHQAYPMEASWDFIHRAVASAEIRKDSLGLDMLEAAFVGSLTWAGKHCWSTTSRHGAAGLCRYWGVGGAQPCSSYFTDAAGLHQPVGCCTSQFIHPSSPGLQRHLVLIMATARGRAVFEGWCSVMASGPA